MRKAFMLLLSMAIAGSVGLASRIEAQSAPAPSDTAAPSDEGVIVVRLDLDRYAPGDWAIVHLGVREDGYVLVAQVDPDGRLRFLFPKSPADDGFLRGGGETILGEANGEGSFRVGDSPGEGLVYAAWSSTPFDFSEFASGDQWSLISLADAASERDPFATLTAMVNRLSRTPVEFDVARYSIYQAAEVMDVSMAYAPAPLTTACGDEFWDPFDPYGYGCDYYSGYTNAYCPDCPPAVPVLPLPPIGPPSPPRPGSPGGPAAAPRIPFKERPRVDLTNGVASWSPGRATSESVAVVRPSPPMSLPPAATPSPRAPIALAPPKSEPSPAPTSPPRVEPPPRIETPSRPEPPPPPPPHYDPPPRPEPPPLPPPPPPPPPPHYDPPPRYDPPSRPEPTPSSPPAYEAPSRPEPPPAPPPSPPASAPSPTPFNPPWAAGRPPAS